MDISELYDATIKKHNAQPTAYTKRPMAQHIIEAYNPLCGDKFKLFLDIDNQRLTQVSFHGYGCAISKAATSILVEKLESQPVENAIEILKNYFETLNTEGVQNAEFSEFESFAAVRQFPERRTCATLTWDAMTDFLESVTRHSNSEM